MKLKKTIAIAAITAALCSGCTVSNYQYYDTTYSFNEAIIALPNGEIVQGKVSSWRDFEDGDQLQVTIDGKTYLTHSCNVVLIAVNKRPEISENPEFPLTP